MLNPNATPLAVADTAVQDSPKLDFESDEPLPMCPMRKDGPSPDEVCDSCQ